MWFDTDDRSHRILVLPRFPRRSSLVIRQALCRLAEFKTLPNADELEASEVTNVIDLRTALRSANPPIAWDDWLRQRPAPEKRELGPLHARVEQLLIWLFYSLEHAKARDPNRLLCQLLAATGREQAAPKKGRFSLSKSGSKKDAKKGKK